MCLCDFTSSKYRVQCSPLSYFQVALTESAQWSHQQDVILERRSFSAPQQPRSLSGIAPSFFFQNVAPETSAPMFKMMFECVCEIDNRVCRIACTLSVVDSVCDLSLDTGSSNIPVRTNWHFTTRSVPWLYSDCLGGVQFSVFPVLDHHHLHVISEVEKCNTHWLLGNGPTMAGRQW